MAATQEESRKRRRRVVAGLLLAIPILVLAIALPLLLGGGEDSATVAVPANSNTRVGIRVGDLLKDEDMVRLVDRLFNDIGGNSTFDEALDRLGGNLGFDPRTVSDVQFFGDFVNSPIPLAADSYLGASVEASFDEQDLISHMGAREGPVETEEYRGNEIFVSSEKAVSFLDSGRTLIGTLTAVREMIDVTKGEGEALAGPIEETFASFGSSLIKVSVGAKDGSLISDDVFEGVDVPGLGPSLVADVQALSATIDKQGDDIAIRVSFDYSDDASAADGANMFTGLIQVSQGLFQGEALSRVLSQAQVDVSGHVVTISVDSNIKDLLGEISFGGGDEFQVKLADGRTLRVWDVEELPNVEPQGDGGPSLLDVVNITLACKDYEDESYEYIDACNAVPDEASSRWGAVTVFGSSGTQTFPWPAFGYTVRVMPDGTAAVFDPSGASVLTEIAQLSILLLPAQ